MLHRRSLLISAMAGAMLAMAPGLHAAEPPKVVASFSILGDMIREIGGDRIQVTTLVGPNGDAHVYQPTPADARAVAGADLVIVNGLAFEGWLDRLVSAAGYKGTVAVATRGMPTIKSEEGEEHEEHEHAAGHEDKHEHEKHGDHDDHDEKKADAHHDDEHGHHHGEFDPHGWQSLTNARIYVRNVTSALIGADPDGAETYKSRSAAYLAKIDALDAEIRAAVKNLPADRRTVVTPHDAFGYFAHEYGITFLAPVGMSTESEASAGDVAKLIRQIRSKRISAVFVENISDRRLLDQISRETGAGIGGTLYSDALSEPDGPAGTYLDMMRHNYRMLVRALGVS